MTFPLEWSRQIPYHPICICILIYPKKEKTKKIRFIAEIASLPKNNYGKWKFRNPPSSGAGGTS